MYMNKFGLTAHMIVKNEDQWAWYAIMSVLPYVDHFFITDTGSSDHTVELIQSLSSPKITFNQIRANSPKDIAQLRQAQLDATTTDWVWIVDGDEIYPDNLVKECIVAIKSDKYEGLVVRRYDLLGDIYHRQLESVGTYNIFGHSGHLLTRFVNKKKITGLHYSGDYPLEGFFDNTNTSTRDRSVKNWYITKASLYHAMYLRRSSLGANLSMFNRTKYKIERGIKIDATYPAIFNTQVPGYNLQPLSRRSLIYEIFAAIITPIKNLKRKIL